MLVMANYAKHYASTIYQSLLTSCLSFLESILSDFEGSLGFLPLGLGRRGGGGGCRKRKPWSNSLIIEDLVVSYISQVEIAVSSYLLVILRERGLRFWVFAFPFLPTCPLFILIHRGHWSDLICFTIHYRVIS